MVMTDVLQPVAVLGVIEQEFPHILRATSGKRFQINRLPEM
jgi:hypothetical protein